MKLLAEDFAMLGGGATGAVLGAELPELAPLGFAVSGAALGYQVAQARAIPCALGPFADEASCRRAAVVTLATATLIGVALGVGYRALKR